MHRLLPLLYLKMATCANCKANAKITKTTNIPGGSAGKNDSRVPAYFVLPPCPDNVIFLFDN